MVMEEEEGEGKEGGKEGEEGEEKERGRMRLTINMILKYNFF